MQVTITRINRRDKNKEGVPYTGKYGPYSLVGLQTQEHGAQWLQGFSNPTNDRWGEGDQVEIEVEKKMWNGKETLNFSSPSPIKVMEQKIVDLTKRLEFIEAYMRGRSQATNTTYPGNVAIIKEEERDFLTGEPLKDYEKAGFVPDEPVIEDGPPW